ncbi:MAG TPA: PH domain-containing protein [Ktedonobacteraceae bacterium]|nr:PH domain-containing protein [Ktedonobacteraceae bacterium]
MSKQISKPALPEDWQPRRREHGGLRQVRRNQDKQLTFKGQDKDEEVKMVVRQHPLFLLRPAAPVLGVLLLFFLVSLLFVRFPEFRQVWTLLDLLLLIALIIALAYFLWRDFLVWWVNIDIITNKRIIACRGFLLPTRKVITLDKVVQVSVHQQSAASIFLSYGHVHIYLAGGEYILKDVPRPGEIRNAVQGIFEELKATAKPAEKPPAVADPEMSALLQKLGKKETVPTLPDADEHYTQQRTPEGLRRPQRRFGGPLRIPAEVTYASDEHTVMYIQRSKWLLGVKLALPTLLLITALVLTFALPLFAVFTIIAIIILLIAMSLMTINYVDDVFILTNKRVIDIERKLIFFYEARVEAEYKNIRDIKIKIRNIFENLLDVGNLYIETPGTNPDINMTLVDHPFFIAEKINQIKGFKEKVDKAKDKNARQEELTKWFTSVASVLEKKMVSRGVPNLQTMDLWSAAAMAAEMGMKVIPVGEDDSYPHIEAGRIVSQNPLPGTLMSLDASSPKERPQIHVVLSKRI